MGGSRSAQYNDRCSGCTALVSMPYISCISVILVLASEFGWKKALAISVSEIVMAIAIGGVAFRALNLVM